MKIGKLSNELLDSIIIKPAAHSAIKNSDVIVRSQIGEDCGAIRFDNEVMVISSDPVTGANENQGKLLVNICANDIAACGAKPVAMTITALFPPKTTIEEIKKVMQDVYEEAGKLQIEIIGGHTEITDAVNKPVVSGTAVGKIRSGNQFIYSSGGKEGQAIVMSKWAGLEGSAVLAHEFEKELCETLGRELVEKAKGFSNQLSVILESQIATGVGGVTAMHDITEGGIFGACFEMSGNGLGYCIDVSKIPVLDETWRICEYFNISPFRLISSGSMLMACDDGNALTAKLLEAGINAAVVGEIRKGNAGYLNREGQFVMLYEPQPDALYTAQNKFKPNAKKVLFVCTGNTCRSPMAEALANLRAGDQNMNVVFESRGMSAYDGEPASTHAVAVMAQMGADLSAHRSATVTQHDVDWADLILTMSASHKSFLKNRFKTADKVFTLAEYTLSLMQDIPDPYGSPAAIYQKCADYIDRCILNLLKMIQKEA